MASIKSLMRLRLPNSTVWLLVLANLLVAGVSLFLWMSRRSPGVQRVEPGVPPLSTGTQLVSPEPGPAIAADVHYVTNRWTWANVESRDYRAYLANLRAVRCPEQTIREIISAELHRVYAYRQLNERAKLPFWTCGSKRRAAERAEAERSRILAAQEKAALSELLGPEAALAETDDHPDAAVEQGLVRLLLGPVREDVIQKVFQIAKEGEAAEQELQTTAGSCWLPSDDEQRQQLRSEMLRKFRALLSTGQFEEFACRISAISLADRLHDFKPSPLELHAMARVKASVAGALSDSPQMEIFDSLTGEQEVRFEDGLRVALGERRFAEYLRATKPALATSEPGSAATANEVR